MARDLRSRLRRIQEARKEGRAAPAEGLRTGSEAAAGNAAGFAPSALGPEWRLAGPFTLKRLVSPEPSPALTGGLPAALPVLIPDLLPYGRDRGPPEAEDLLFFDLETTGLSGGAGTVAFLAAFGRFVPEAALRRGRIRVSQYLLTDYPGEPEFLAAVLAELETPAPSGRPPLVVTYNGKSFDSQILKIRCLMNGLRPPAYSQADLLHPCRRLWKRVLPNCSQGEIEAAVLGLDRTGDIPGALAPEIWFSFLKTRETGELLKICDHNLRDIGGLAALFAALARVAEDPAAAPETYRVDLENLALRWFYAAEGRGPFREYAAGEAAGPEQRRAEALLTLAADRDCPRAAWVWAKELFRRGRAEEGRRRLRLLVEGDFPEEVRAAALRSLAIDSEWRLKDPVLALAYTEQLFFLKKNVQTGITGDILKRRERLSQKIQSGEAAMKIRPMTIDDYQKVHELWEAAPGVGLRSLDDSEQGIRKFLNRNPGCSFVAEQNREPVGIILSGHDGRRGSIYHATVKESLRGQGIGKALVRAVEKAMSREGINKLGLVAFKANIGSNRFWRALEYNVREDLAYRDKSLNPKNT